MSNYQLSRRKPMTVLAITPTLIMFNAIGTYRLAESRARRIKFDAKSRWHIDFDHLYGLKPSTDVDDALYHLKNLSAVIGREKLLSWELIFYAFYAPITKKFIDSRAVKTHARKHKFFISMEISGFTEMLDLAVEGVSTNMKKISSSVVVDDDLKSNIQTKLGVLQMSVVSADTVFIDSRQSTVVGLIFAIIATAVDGCACVKLSTLYATSTITCLYLFCGFFADIGMYHAVSDDSVYVFGRHKQFAVEQTLEANLIKYASMATTDSGISVVSRAVTSSTDFVEFYAEYSKSIDDIYREKLSYVTMSITSVQRIAAGESPVMATDLSEKFAKITSLPLSDDERRAAKIETSEPQT